MTPVSTTLALPSFIDPPVVETAMGIEFAPLSSLGFIQLARLATLWEERYPASEEQPALAPGTRLTPDQQSISLEFVPGIPPVRIWLHGDGNGWLVQAQHDRLILNWRAEASADPYPRYPALRAEFLRLWEEFIAHLDAAGLETPVPITAAFTYVNRITVEPGAGPQSAITLFQSAPTALPGVPSFTRFQTVREITPDDERFSGQVLVTGEPDFDELSEAYAVTIATRLAVPPGSSSRSIEEALDAARSIGVRVFAAVTTDEKHNEWGMESS